MKTLTFDVKGMHCPSCETIITEELSELDGVESAEADFKKGKVIVSFSEKKTNPEKLKEIIKNEGYEVA